MASASVPFYTDACSFKSFVPVSKTLTSEHLQSRGLELMAIFHSGTSSRGCAGKACTSLEIVAGWVDADMAAVPLCASSSRGTV